MKTPRDQVLRALKNENQVIQQDPFRKAILEGWLSMYDALEFYADNLNGGIYEQSRAAKALKSARAKLLNAETKEKV